MKLSELIQYLGCDTSDAQLDAFLLQNSLKMPKTATPNNSATYAADKAKGLEYIFSYSILNEKYYPSRQIGKKWQTWLCDVHIACDGAKKNSVVNDPTFWDLGVTPQMTLDEVKKIFTNPPTESQYEHTYAKSISEDVEILVTYRIKADPMLGIMSVDPTKIYTIRLRIKQYWEIISYLFLNTDKPFVSDHKNTREEAVLWLKWLMEKRYLKIPAAAYVSFFPPSGGLRGADMEGVLAFAKQYLGSKVWANNLTDEPYLLQFLQSSWSSNLGFENEKGEEMTYYLEVYMKAIGKHAEYCKIYYGEYEALQGLSAFQDTIPFDDASFQLFVKEYDKAFDWFKSCRQLVIGV